MHLSSNDAVETVGLTKVFGSNRAVDGIDLRVPTGSIYGFLGPNGAGKTTTIRILATLLRPDSGTGRVLGHDVVKEPDAVRARISMTGQFAATDEDLTARENLAILGRLLGYSRRDSRSRGAELLEAFDIHSAADRPVKTLSGGMRRRLDIAASLLSTPDLLFLDEPTTGLDPASRNQVWDTVRLLASAGTTILLTTQYLEEADQLAGRIAVIDRGRLIAEGTPAELKAAGSSGTFHIRLANVQEASLAADTLDRFFDLPTQRDEDGSRLTAHGVEPQRATAALAALA